MKTKILIVTLICVLALTACQPPAVPVAVATVAPVTQPTTAPAATNMPPLAPMAAGEPAATQPAEPAPTAVRRPPAGVDPLRHGLGRPQPIRRGSGERSAGCAGAAAWRQRLSPGPAHRRRLTRLQAGKRCATPTARTWRWTSVVFRLFPNLTGGSTTVSNLTVNGQPVEPVYSPQDSVHDRRRWPSRSSRASRRSSPWIST